MSEYACLGLRYNLKDYKLISKSGRLRSNPRIRHMMKKSTEFTNSDPI